MFIYNYIDTTEPDPGTSSSLEPSNLGEIILNYQDMFIGVNETFISWFYVPNYASPCVESQYYEFSLYRRSGSGDMQYLNSTYTVNKNITINSSHLYSQDDDTLIYFTVSALANPNVICTTTEYYQTISGLGMLCSSQATPTVCPNLTVAIILLASDKRS